MTSLQKAVGKDYQVIYPQMQSDETAPDFGWLKQIGEEIGKLIDHDAILVAHSLGASLLLKYLSENKPPKETAAILLIATPFWSGKEKWVQGLKLQENFAENLPKATFHEMERGGHQLKNHLNLVAKDIKNL